jgi:hypothetical protein
MALNNVKNGPEVPVFLSFFCTMALTRVKLHDDADLRSVGNADIARPCRRVRYDPKQRLRAPKPSTDTHRRQHSHQLGNDER